MRIAVVSDLHDNRTALEAVLKDLKITAPDLVLCGGDVAGSGSAPVDVVDQIRDLQWPCVLGNTDEMLARPESLTEFAAQSPGIRPLVPVIEEMASWTRSQLGEERLEWLAALPMQIAQESLLLMHAGLNDPWRAPDRGATFENCDAPLIVYGHIHQPFIRGKVINTGSVSLPYDGDPRASYLLIEDGVPSIRRVEYDLEREIKSLRESGLPHAEWIVRSLLAARPVLP